MENKPLTQEEIKAIAAQLSKPEGELGKSVAELMNTHNIRMTEETIRALNLQSGENILELGHGNCGHLEKILSSAKNLNYCGLEISSLMKKEAEQINSHFIQSGNTSFHLYDGGAIPFPDNSFQAIMTVNTIYFWEKPDRLIQEMARILDPNGRISIGFAQEHFMKKLPFTPYGFTLYDTEKVCRLFHTHELLASEISGHTDHTITKTGETVEREFTVITFRKTLQN